MFPGRGVASAAGSMAWILIVLTIEVPVSHRGMTLIELMIVLVIIALVAMLSYPAVTAVLAEQRVQRASDDVISVLQAARFRALLRRRTQVVTVTLADDVPGGSLELHESTTGACNDHGAAPVQSVVIDRPYDEGGNVGLVGLTPDGAAAGICFKPDGKVYDGTGGFPAGMGYVVFELARYEGSGGPVRVGVRKEILLSHHGVARTNRKLLAQAAGD